MPIWSWYRSSLFFFFFFFFVLLSNGEPRSGLSGPIREPLLSNGKKGVVAVQMAQSSTTRSRSETALSPVLLRIATVCCSATVHHTNFDAIVWVDHSLVLVRQALLVKHHGFMCLSTESRTLALFPKRCRWERRPDGRENRLLCGLLLRLSTLLSYRLAVRLPRSRFRSSA